MIKLGLGLPLDFHEDAAESLAHLWLAIKSCTSVICGLLRLISAQEERMETANITAVAL